MSIRIDLSGEKIRDFKHFGAFPKIISNTLFFGKRVSHIALKPFVVERFTVQIIASNKRPMAKMPPAHSEIRQNLSSESKFI
jgi:hypothetical protein